MSNARRDLMAAFADPDVRLIVPATGGKGAAQLLDLLDYDLIRANPKVLTAVSDPSIVANAIYQRAGLATLHGRSGFDFFQSMINAETEAAFWRIACPDQLPATRSPAMVGGWYAGGAAT